MAPKKQVAAPAQVVETRTQTEIELAKATELFESLNDQLNKCKDGILELSNLSTKVRSLEQELQPKEADLKALSAAFAKVAEGASALKRPMSMIRAQTLIGGDVDIAEAAAASTTSPMAAAAAAGTATPSGGVSPPQSRPATVPASVQQQLGLSGQAAVAAPPAQQQPPPTSAGDDSSDRDAIRILVAASKAALLAVLQSVYETPLTPSEKKAEQDGIELLTLVASTRKTEQPRVDIDITCPIGIEPSVFFDILRLRAQRVVIERSVADLVAQINDAKNGIAKRKEEGASKLLQKKLEKQVEDAKKRMTDLQREREGEELSRRAISLAQMQQQQQDSPPSKLNRSASKVK